MRVLLVEPLEAPVFSRAPIASQEFIVGIHRSHPIPSPTTIAGMLGSALDIALRGKSDTHIGVIKALLAELEEKFSCRRPIVKGPFIWFRGLSEEPYVCLGDIFIKLRVIDKMVAEIEAGRREGEVKCMDCVKSSIERRVGVRLKRGYNDAVEKVASKGYMYNYSLVRYEIIADDRSIPRSVSPIYVYLLNCDNIEISGVYRVGGEGRVATVSTILRESLPARIAESLSRLKSPREVVGGKTYLTLTQVPLVPQAEDQQLLNFEKMHGLEFVSDIIGVIMVEEGSEPMGKSMLKWKLKRKIERFNLGYSEVLNARRPQVLAMPIGTLIKSKSVKEVDRVVEVIDTLWGLGLPSLLELQPPK
jgi:hypothetical protein